MCESFTPVTCIYFWKVFNNGWCQYFIFSLLSNLTWLNLVTVRVLLWYFYTGKNDSVEICQWRWQYKYTNKGDFHWADLLIIKFPIACSSCFLLKGKDWENAGYLPRNQLSITGLKHTSNLTANILPPYSSIQANKPFVCAFFEGGNGEFL